MSKPITLTFVSSAFNEAANLEELHQRCRAAHAKLQQEFWKREEIQFSFVVADNGSRDGSLGVLEELCNRDPAVVALANQGNYGPEPSAANALEQVRMSDLVVILCSDLQDPPELAVAMARTLLEQQGVDAVLAVKKRSAGGPLVRMARRLYYTVLGYSSRLRSVPNGFHGFGCYRQSVVEDALRFWRGSDLNLRQCLANACQSPALMEYAQAERLRGASSYRGWGYSLEAVRALLSGDAAGSRLGLLIGSAGLALALLLGLVLLLNFLRGSSGYGGGIPTVMGLVLISFALQMLMFAILSRQIESLRMGGIRPIVHFRKIGSCSKPTNLFEP